MTKTELERAVADAAGVEKRTAAAVLDALEDIVTSKVRAGEAVTIRPGFIKVSRKDVKARAAAEGTNPFTGEPDDLQGRSCIEDREGHCSQEAEGWHRREAGGNHSATASADRWSGRMKRGASERGDGRHAVTRATPPRPDVHPIGRSRNAVRPCDHRVVV